MIMQHTMLMYAVNMGEGTDVGDIFLLLGTAPAAPVFMCIMGVFFGKSRNTRLKPGIMRGLTLLGMGYLLNIVRFTLPLLITEHSSVMFGDSATPFSVAFASDILQLAGLSLIVLSLMKRYLPWRGTWPVIALVITLVSPALWGHLDGLAEYNPLWGSGKAVVFPFFPFFIYPLLGMFYSRYLLETHDLASLMKKIALAGVGFLGAGIVTWDMFVVGDYSRSGLGVHLTIVGFLLVWLPFCWLMTEKIADNRVFRLLDFWSKQVTTIYIIQWLLYGWGILVFGINRHTPFTAAMIGVVVFVLTHILTKFYIAIRTGNNSLKQAKARYG
jgi:hypothetical protein